MGLDRRIRFGYCLKIAGPRRRESENEAMNPGGCLQAVLQNMNELVVICDPDLKIATVNDKLSETLGRSPEELAGRDILELVPGNYRQWVIDQTKAWLDKTSPFHCEVPALHRDGSKIFLQVKAVAVFEDQSITGFIILGEDMTDRKRMEDALRRSEDRFRTSIENMLDCFGIYRAVREESGRIVNFLVEYVNGAACASHLMTRERQIGRPLLEILPVYDQSDLFHDFSRVVETGKPLIREWLICDDRQNLFRACDVRAVKLDDGVAVCWRDITDRKRAEEELRALTLVDELTGLYNRRGFVTLAQQQLKIARRMNREMLLLFADVDNLKTINDTLGHHEGDRALVDIAQILKDTFRDPDIIARYGGDEFAVLIIEASRAGAAAMAGRLKENIRLHNSHGGRPYELSLSVGIAHFNPDQPCFVNELLERADRLMYRDKRCGQTP